MSATGWTGVAPAEEAPGMPVTGFAGFIGSMRGGPEDRPDPLTRALYAPEPRAPEPRDPDEIAANMMVRGYAAGSVSDLAQRYADKRAELAGELEKIGKGERVAARVRGMLERGQIGGLEAARMMDGDFGDAHRAEQLQRQCENLGRQIADVSAMIAPQQQRAPDPVESASRSAQQLLAGVTRGRAAAAPARGPERRPFTSRGQDAVRSELECVYCVQNDVSHESSVLLHLDPESKVPITTAQQLEQLQQAEQAARHAYQPGAVITTGYQPVRAGGQDYVYDKRHDEISRLEVAR